LTFFICHFSEAEAADVGALNLLPETAFAQKVFYARKFSRAKGKSAKRCRTNDK
jgi:hypothetical protein